MVVGCGWETALSQSHWKRKTRKREDEKPCLGVEKSAPLCSSPHFISAILGEWVSPSWTCHLPSTHPHRKHVGFTNHPVGVSLRLYKKRCWGWEKWSGKTLVNLRQDSLVSKRQHSSSDGANMTYETSRSHRITKVILYVDWLQLGFLAAFLEPRARGAGHSVLRAHLSLCPIKYRSPLAWQTVTYHTARCGGKHTGSGIKQTGPDLSLNVTLSFWPRTYYPTFLPLNFLSCKLWTMQTLLGCSEN